MSSWLHLIKEKSKRVTSSSNFRFRSRRRRIINLHDWLERHGIKAQSRRNSSFFMRRSSQHRFETSYHLAVEVKSLHFYLKNLQEKGLLSIDSSFDYSSIDESVFRNFVNYPTSTHQISSRIDTITVPSPSRKYIWKIFWATGLQILPTSIVIIHYLRQLVKNLILSWIQSTRNLHRL